MYVYNRWNEINFWINILKLQKTNERFRQIDLLDVFGVCTLVFGILTCAQVLTCVKQTWPWNYLKSVQLWLNVLLLYARFMHHHHHHQQHQSTSKTNFNWIYDESEIEYAYLCILDVATQ